MERTPKMKPGDRYRSFTELACFEREGRDYRRVWEARRSPILVLAPHGGGIERGTSEIARAVAGENCSWYCFEGLKVTGNQDLHVTSTRFDEPQALALLSTARLVLTIHGLRGSFSRVYAGGLDFDRQQCLLEHLESAGFNALADRDPQHAASQLLNLCNRGISGRGVQFEISAGLRRQMFPSLTRHGCQHPTPVFHAFVAAVQSGLGLLAVTS